MLHFRKPWDYLFTILCGLHGQCMVDWEELLPDETALNCKQYCRCEFPTRNQKTLHLSALAFSPAMCCHQTTNDISVLHGRPFPEHSSFSYPFSEQFLYDPALIEKSPKMDLAIQLGFATPNRSTRITSA